MIQEVAGQKKRGGRNLNPEKERKEHGWGEQHKQDYAC